jgi:hypothetical protein
MTTTLSDGTTSYTPDLLGYTASRPVGNRVHPIPGSDSPAISVGPTGLRTGTLQFRFISEASVMAVESSILGGAVFTLADTTYGSLNMSFVITGDFVRTLEPVTKTVWDIHLDFQEVT